MPMRFTGTKVVKLYPYAFRECESISSIYHVSSTMLFLLAAVACLVGSALAQTPPSYTLAETNKTLGVKYGKVNVVAGETIGYKGQSLHAENLRIRGS